MTFTNFQIDKCIVLAIYPVTKEVHLVFRLPKSNPPTVIEMQIKKKTIFDYLNREGFFGNVPAKWSVHAGVILE